MLKTLAHAFLGGMFISGGANTFMQPEGRAAKVAAAGISQARQATILNGAVMVIAGSALASSIAPKLGATALIGCLIPTTVVGHPFWKEETPAGRTNQQVQFLKNLAMIGGLLLVLVEKKD